MGAPLEYDFKVIGRAAVEREVASLERRFMQSAAKLSREFDKLGRGRGGGGSSGSGSRSSGSSRGEMFGPGRREQMAQIKANEKAAIRAAREERRAVEQLNRSRQSLHNQRTREERKAASEVVKATKLQQREAESHQRYQSRMMQERHKHLEKEKAKTREITDARVAFVKSTAGGAVGRAAGVVGSIGRAGLAVGGISGAAIGASSISEATRLDETARRLSINARGSGESGVDSETLRKEFSTVGIAAGLSPEAIAAGVSSYVDKTGDLDTARKNSAILATVSQGSNADPTDIFNAAADLSDKLDVKNVEDMSQAFAILSAQGKKGAFTLKQMATEFPAVLSSAANAGVRGTSGVRDIGAVMQLAMKATGNSAEAGTSVNSMFRQMAAKSEDMQKGKSFSGRKVQVWENGDKTKPMRNFADVALDAISASRGSIAQLNEVFDARGVKAINPMIAKYRETYNSTKGTDKQKDTAAKGAAGAVFANFRDVQASFKDVEADARDAMKSFSVQMEILNSKLKDAVASELFPAIVSLVPELQKLIPIASDVAKAFVRMVSFLAENPFLGLGAVVTAAIVSEIVKAGASKAIGAAIGGLMGGGGIGGPSVPGVKGLGTLKGGLATGAAVLGVGLAVDQADTFMDQNGGLEGAKSFFGMGKGKGWGFDAVNDWQNQQARIKAGRNANNSSLTSTGQPVVSPVATTASVSPVNNEAAATADKLKELQATIAAANAELLKLGKSVPNTGDKPTGIK